jgi:hypothetical protein
MDGHARTSTELSVVATVSPSTTSVHLNRLKIAHHRMQNPSDRVCCPLFLHGRIGSGRPD